MAFVIGAKGEVVPDEDATHASAVTPAAPVAAREKRRNVFRGLSPLSTRRNILRGPSPGLPPLTPPRPFMIRRIAFVLALVPALAGAQESFDRTMVSKIRDEGLARSQAWGMVDTLATVIGPRLTASPAYMQAARWAQAHLVGWGLAGVHLESWPFGRGWELDRFSLEMTAPRYAPLLAYPDAWSSSTQGEITGTPLYIAGLSADSLERMRDRLRGAIVMTQPMMTTFIREDRINPTAADAPASVPPQPMSPTTDVAPRTGPTEAQRIARVLHDAGVGAVLKPSRGEHGTIFLQTRILEASAVPSVVVSGEQYNTLVRMLEDHVPLTVRVTLQAHFLGQDTSGYNVIAELPGSDPRLRDQVVMIGAHLDSWHAATGATDNADGVATVMEAMRILTAVGAHPRRTIRVALWGGEEEGLYGSRAWVARHLAGDANRAERERMSMYLNVDPGYGKVYGFYMEGNEPAKAIFDAWLAPFGDLGARHNIIAGIRNTDHLSFIAVGVPGFNPVQEYANYDVRIHHTNMDTMERMNPDDLKEAAIVFATFAYDAAMRDDMMPRASGSSASAPSR
jgi:carboxypeptidase Q